MDVKLPKLGEGADSGTVVNVFVKEGDQVTKDYQVTVFEYPLLLQTDAKLVFPSYTNMEEKLVQDVRRVSCQNSRQTGRQTQRRSADCFVGRRRGSRRRQRKRKTNQRKTRAGA